MASKGRRKHAWEALSDDELLEIRLCDLKLRLEGSWLEPLIEQVKDELSARGLKMRPGFYISDEWFSPTDIPAVAVPFFLVHPRLMKLERRMMLEVEGGNRQWCIKLIRHEVGHAVHHAFRLHRRRKWQEHFGLSSKPYPEFYTPRPADRRFVQHLDMWYAQAHPDEDFAETFAVWLRPGNRWKSRYADWPCAEKLWYVDELMAELAGQPPLVKDRTRPDSLSRLTQTLGEYYEEKQSNYGTSYPDLWDRDLYRLFDPPDHAPDAPRAAPFLRKHRSHLRRSVSRWTSERAFTVDQVLRDMIGRTRELDLRVTEDAEQLLVDFSIMLTLRTAEYFFTRRDRTPL